MQLEIGERRVEVGRAPQSDSEQARRDQSHPRPEKVPLTDLTGESELVDRAVPDAEVDPAHLPLPDVDDEIGRARRAVDVAALQAHVGVEAGVVDPLLAEQELGASEKLSAADRDLARDEL